MAPARTEHEEFPTAIPEVPVTEERLPFVNKGKGGQEGALKEPGAARANQAASVEAPNGTEKDDYARRYKHLSVLQQHCAFFDRDSDGVIWPQDTYIGFRRLAYNPILALIAVFVIHANFSYPTLPNGRILPDPFFRLYTENVHKDKHGSDSGTYDHEGRFVPQKFEDIFSKYGSGDKQGITLKETWNYMKGQRCIADPIGWGGAFFECELGHVVSGYM
ncbi:hypothetical protein CJF30_00008474 [Rutstroemia sp. NJR-2017a BBW]|nr:hypothetical protein CJF30_00008474 [Rutstroemia sp. NJR-2017a BBW]